ncbi:1,4-dihydroxy-2-naphthoate polyprenyltransferase [Nocardioides limicola]|uniref:1,4-dihydroxy-2-naphthoate polyprenyltransferase n=1 Tax=Nocardioides limicola TaxID=2803368 RepID=UPI00193B1460|nr:1,4-dihydroxy-2-naphthoate polyprenyltransferase [Nocardioides sp. DJM-14]
MATASEWLDGARLRTLPAAVAPVLVGTGIAAHLDAAVWWKAALALIVAVGLQIGVNYANDYSDGIRGTDDDRVGPQRLVGSGRARPDAVKAAAFGSFAAAACAGLLLAATTAWWLVAVGVVCIAAAWYYTGGKKPYGYAGLGELMVFVFFGLVAVAGTTFVQTGTAAGLGAALVGGVGVGALACAILVANNLRDIAGDTAVGKRTLAVRIGDERTRVLFLSLVLAAGMALVALAAQTSPWALLGGLYIVPATMAVAKVGRGATGPALIGVLQRTGISELLWGLGVFVGLTLR